jgi:hypothetical protein
MNPIRAAGAFRFVYACLPTLAEGRVAIAVSSGVSVPDTARRLRISPNMVKTVAYGYVCPETAQAVDNNPSKDYIHTHPGSSRGVFRRRA